MTIATESNVLVPPPVATASDAEVDIEVLKVVPKAFEINSEQTANWLVKKVIAAREYGEKVKRWCDQERRRAEREETTLMFLFGRQIERWTREEIGKFDGRRKSIPLPAGVVGYRHEAIKLVIDDEDAVLQWAKQHVPTAVLVTERLVKTPLNEHFEATGEIPEIGAHIQPEGDRFYVR